jgi:hypothetical protein
LSAGKSRARPESDVQPVSIRPRNFRA